MLKFLRHHLTKKEKILARWSFIHVLIALLCGVGLAGALLIWQMNKDSGRVADLQHSAVEAVDLPSPVPPDTAKIGGPFVLTSQDGKTVSDKDFSGKYLLVYFGYTSCPDMCPTGLQSISRALDLLKTEANKVQPLFITVDPARDTPARLKEYDSAFHPSILGLTGTAQQIADVAKEYQVYYQKGEGYQDYEVEHSSVIYLMNPAGDLVRTFDEEADPKAIVAALNNEWGKPAPATVAP